MRTLKSFALLVAACFALTLPALADGITLTLLNPLQTIAAGQTVTFNATVTALAGNTKNIYLNSDNSSINDAGSILVLNDDDFYANFPIFVTPTGGTSTYTGALFTVTNNGTAAEKYTGVFNLIGGANGSAVRTLATVDFGSPAVAVTPEPSSFVLLGTGMLGLVGLLKRRVSA